MNPIRIDAVMVEHGADNQLSVTIHASTGDGPTVIRVDWDDYNEALALAMRQIIILVTGVDP